jgi:transmembrane sensor
VKDALRPVTSDSSIARMWNRIDARGRAPSSRRTGRTWALATAAAALAAVAVAMLWPSRSAPARGPILLADGASWGVVDKAQDLRFGDGSVITLAPGSLIDPLSNSADAVVVQQARGVVTYDIAPHHRRWTIECGAVSVEVVGTRFRVERDEHHVRVDVSRGVVLVRGARVPDHVARLTVGMHLDVATDDVASVTPPTVTTDPVASVAPPIATVSAPPPPRPAHAAVAQPAAASTNATWRQLAAAGANDDAYATLGQGGVASAAKTASVEELFALADVARLSGHAAEAIDPLQRIVDHHADDARASLAALTLGRIQLRALDEPREAAAWLATAITLGLPAGLTEETYALQIEALSRAGDRAAARRAYARFVERFPSSTRTAELQRWIADP